MLKRALGALALVCAVTTAQAQTYPERPVKVIVGFSAGSGPDVIARAISAQLTNDLKQQFYVENRTGANGALAIKSLITSEPDGYTMLYSSSSISSVPHVYKSLGHDIMTEMIPVATSGILDGYFMLVNPSTPVKSVAEFIDYAKKNRVVYGSPGVGNVLHLAAEMFKLKAGIEMEHVPFRGAAPLKQELLSGRIQVGGDQLSTSLAEIRAGTLKALACNASQRTAALPDVPTVRELGFPELELEGWNGLFLPAKTPRDIIEKLSQEIAAVVKQPDIVKRFEGMGAQSVGSRPADQDAILRRQMDQFRDVIRSLKIDQ